MKIDKQYLTINKYSRPGTKLTKITKVAFHYVGNANSKGINNRNYFENLKVGKKDSKGNYIYASSHYIVGLEGEIIACVPESEIAYCTNDANSYSLSVEMCHPTNDGKFNTMTYNSAVDLGVDFCKRYNLDPRVDFIRHYDVTKKLCPKYWVDNPSLWQKFKNDVHDKLNPQETQKYAVLINSYSDIVKARSVSHMLKYDDNLYSEVIPYNSKYAVKIYPLSPISKAQDIQKLVKEKYNAYSDIISL